MFAKNWPYIFATFIMVFIATSSLFYWQNHQTPLVINEPAQAIGRILWVDDHPENNSIEREYFISAKIGVYQTTSTEEALLLLSMYKYSAIISDMGRGDNSLAGIDLLNQLRARGDQTPFYFYTILSSEAQRQLVAKHGGQGVAVEQEQLNRLVLANFTLEPDKN